MRTAHPLSQATWAGRSPASTRRLKVTGAARYPSDEPLANPAFACLATSSIARGAIREIESG